MMPGTVRPRSNLIVFIVAMKRLYIKVCPICPTVRPCLKILEVPSILRILS